jgi:SAM-dependent methyltransferase
VSAAAARPFDAATARRIATAFLPQSRFGNRFPYYYALAKLRTDPLYPGALAALRGSDAPVLDLGCGLGILAHALRLDGQAMSYLGVDHDLRKLERARSISARARLAGVAFAEADLAGALPEHQGNVALLDVLQYLPEAARRRLLDEAAARLSPGARLVIRTSLDGHGQRNRATRASDRFGNLVGWMQAAPRSYPGREELQSQLAATGLAAEFTPLYGNTPFDNWLVVAQR